MTLDSETAIVGVCVEEFALASGASTTKTYPAWTGRAIDIICDQSDAGWDTDVSLGYPRLTVVAKGYDRTFFVFVS